jgi:hypothetical protein
MSREWRPFRAHSIVTNVAEPLTGVYWEDLRFPATVLRERPNQENPAFDETTPGRLFRHTDTDSMYAIAQLPHAWREGSQLRPHIHWQKTTSAPGGVYWQIEYKWAPIGEASDANFTPIGSAVPAASDADTANVHALTNLGTISGEGKTLSDMLLIKISRVHDNAADTYGAAARLIEFDIHYQVSSPGSRQEFIK